MGCDDGPSSGPWSRMIRAAVSPAAAADAGRQAALVLLAERDALRAQRDRVLAYLDEAESSQMFRRTHGGGEMPAIVTVPKIRELLGGGSDGN